MSGKLIGALRHGKVWRLRNDFRRFDVRPAFMPGPLNPEVMALMAEAKAQIGLICGFHRPELRGRP